MENTPKDITAKLPYEAPSIEVVVLPEIPSILYTSPLYSGRGGSGDSDDGWFDGN
jgi:hypothetical protein